MIVRSARHGEGADGLCEACHKPYPCSNTLMEPLERLLNNPQSGFTKRFKAFPRDEEVMVRCTACDEEVRAPKPLAPYRMLERQEQWRATLSEHRARRGEAS